MDRTLTKAVMLSTKLDQMNSRIRILHDFKDTWLSDLTTTCKIGEKND